MNTASAKAKGRRLQQWVAGLIRMVLAAPADEVRSTSMGAGGSDVQLSGRARSLMPFAIECKNQERVNLWSSYRQAQVHAEKEQDLHPVLVLKKNNYRPLVVIDAEFFFAEWGNMVTKIGYWSSGDDNR